MTTANACLGTTRSGEKCKNKTTNPDGNCGQCLGVATSTSAPHLGIVDGFSAHCEWCGNDLPHDLAFGRGNGRHLCEDCAVECALCHHWVANDDSEVGPNDEDFPEYPVCTRCSTKMDVESRGGPDDLDLWLGDAGVRVLYSTGSPFEDASQWRLDTEEVDEAVAELRDLGYTELEKPKDFDELEAIVSKLELSAGELLDDARQARDEAWDEQDPVRAVRLFKLADEGVTHGEALNKLAGHIRVTPEVHALDEQDACEAARGVLLDVADAWDERTKHQGGVVVSDDGQLTRGIKNAIAGYTAEEPVIARVTDDEFRLEPDGGYATGFVSWKRVKALGYDDAENVLYSCQGSVEDLLRVDGAVSRMPQHRVGEVFELLDGDWNGGYADSFSAVARASRALDDNGWAFFTQHAHKVGNDESAWSSYDELARVAGEPTAR